MRIKEELTEFFKPRFSTWEIEDGKLASGCKHEITGMVYDDDKRFYPTRTWGIIHDSNIKRVVAWDKYGVCRIGGVTSPEFNKVRSHARQSEIASAKRILFAGIGIIILSIFIALS